MGKRTVHIWYPPEPGVHGQVWDTLDAYPTIVVAKPPKMTSRLNLEKNAYELDFTMEQDVLDVMQWKSTIGPNFFIACKRTYPPQGAMDPSIPSPMQMMELWPNLTPSICEKFYCPHCKSEQYGYKSLDYYTRICMTCKTEYSEQWLDQFAVMSELKNKLDYKSKASSEFVGVEGLDPSLWNRTDLA